MAITTAILAQGSSIVGAYRSQRQMEGSPAPAGRAESPAAIVSLSPEARKLMLAIPPANAPVLKLDPASDRDGDGKVDQPDLNGDGQPDGLDMNGDGVQDIPPESKLQRDLRKRTEGNIRGVRGRDGALRQLSDDEKKMLTELRARDAEVRAHEQAHKAAGGGLTGAISYTFQTGPDGKAYAIGGEVPISASPSSDPAETIRRAQAVRAAALAPASPSGADMAAAGAAAKMEADARAQQLRERQAPAPGGPPHTLDEARSGGRPRGLAGFTSGTAAEAALTVPGLESLLAA